MEDTYTNTEAVRAAMAARLREDPPALEQLHEWLRGHDLPPAGHTLEPYQWILRGLPLGPDRFSRETRLAEALAALLSASQEQAVSEEVLYNSLMLAAALGPQKALSAPLREMLHRETLTGQWRGVELRQCLADALMENQLDRSLEPVWNAMLEGRIPADRFLQGTPDNGLRGVLLMPKSETEPDQPALDAIGRALKEMAKRLSERQDRRARFREAVQEVKNAHPQRVIWDLDLILQAHEYNWPLWAFESLPRLYVLLETLPSGARRLMVWKYILYPIRECLDSATRVFLGGTLVETTVPTTLTEFLDEIVAVLEPLRASHQLPSDKSLRAAVAHELQQQAACNQLAGARDLAHRYELAIEQLYDELSVGRRIWIVEDDRDQAARVDEIVTSNFEGVKTTIIPSERAFRRLVDGGVDKPDLVLLRISPHSRPPNEGNVTIRSRAGIRYARELAENDVTRGVPVIPYAVSDNQVLEGPEIRDFEALGMPPVCLTPQSDNTSLIERIKEVTQRAA